MGPHNSHIVIVAIKKKIWGISTQIYVYESWKFKFWRNIHAVNIDFLNLL